MRTVYRRELHSYFYTPIAYVFIGVFTLLSGVFFITGNLADRSSNLLRLMQNMSYLWMLLCPVLTMRLMAAERQQHTDQLLFSSPASLTGIVLGKFFAACTVMLCTVLLTGVYAAIIAAYGQLYIGETLVGYLGFVLQGMAFIALDMMVSCLMKSQITAVMACFGVNLFLWLADVLALALNVQIFTDAFAFISLYRRFQTFSLGQLGFADGVFYLSFIFIMLFLCVRFLDARRWSEA